MPGNAAKDNSTQNQTCGNNPEEEKTGVAKESIPNGSIVESKPKELYPYMPVLHLTGRTLDNAIPQDRTTPGRYICPFYMSTIRGPTFVFAGPLRTNVHANKWILAACALVMQPD